MFGGTLVMPPLPPQPSPWTVGVIRTWHVLQLSKLPATCESSCDSTHGPASCGHPNSLLSFQSALHCLSNQDGHVARDQNPDRLVFGLILNFSVTGKIPANFTDWDAQCDGIARNVSRLPHSSLLPIVEERVEITA